jgi:hypothetical protein
VVVTSDPPLDGGDFRGAQAAEPNAVDPGESQTVGLPPGAKRYAGGACDRRRRQCRPSGGGRPWRSSGRAITARHGNGNGNGNGGGTGAGEGYSDRRAPVTRASSCPLPRCVTRGAGT